MNIINTLGGQYSWYQMWYLKLVLSTWWISDVDILGDQDFWYQMWYLNLVLSTWWISDVDILGDQDYWYPLQYLTLDWVINEYHMLILWRLILLRLYVYHGHL